GDGKSPSGGSSLLRLPAPVQTPPPHSAPPPALPHLAATLTHRRSPFPAAAPLSFPSPPAPPCKRAASRHGGSGGRRERAVLLGFGPGETSHTSRGICVNFGPCAAREETGVASGFRPSADLRRPALAPAPMPCFPATFTAWVPSFPPFCAVRVPRSPATCTASAPAPRSPSPATCTAQALTPCSSSPVTCLAPARAPHSSFPATCQSALI
ncbi:hypothetical protein U9M48_001960, partial [Paspalum notatum var. saurae]